MISLWCEVWRFDKLNGRRKVFDSRFRPPPRQKSHSEHSIKTIKAAAAVAVAAVS